MDILYDCAKAYQQLMDNEYHIKLFVDSEIKEFNISFSEKEFKHLIGLEKLKDKAVFHDMSSATMLNYILNHNIVYDSSLYSDVPNMDIHEQIIDSSLLNDPINNSSKSDVIYNITDKILELTNLYNLMHSATNDSLSIFKWFPHISSDFRPNHSDINADLLLVFADSVTQKAANETVCAFFIEEKDNGASGVSIFPTNISYSDDGNVPPLHQCKILSFKEHCISQNSVINLIECSSVELEKAEKIARDKIEDDMISSNIKELKQKRGKAIKNQNAKNKSKYQSSLKIFTNLGVYDVSMLNKVLKRLEDQLCDPNNADASDMIKNEIAFVEKEIQRRETLLEHSNDAMKEILSPTSDLKNKVSNFSLLPERSENSFSFAPLCYSSGALAAELPDPNRYNPLGELLKNVIAGLSNVSKKISEFLTAPLPSVHIGERKQPSQARKPSARKINYNIPFAKQTLSDERSEPSAAKPERRSSWIDKMLSSAKREADENNSKHEIKRHDKDKSL